jgi:hypothetical protein
MSQYSDEGIELAAAIEESLKLKELKDREEAELKRAIELSVVGSSHSPVNTTADEVKEIQYKLARETYEHMDEFGKTCILDTGHIFRVGLNTSDDTRQSTIGQSTIGPSTIGQSTIGPTTYTNKCAVLSVWFALTIQTRLGLCTATFNRGIRHRKFNTVNDLYVQFNNLLHSCEKFRKDNNYGLNERFNQEWFSLMANLIEMNIYVWSVEDQMCSVYYPVDSYGVYHNGVMGAPNCNLELLDPSRKIFLVRTPGHYMILPSMFVMQGVNTAECYDKVDNIVREIYLHPRIDAYGNNVNLVAPAESTIRNLVPGGGGKSYVTLETPEPIKSYMRPETLDAVKFS